MSRTRIVFLPEAPDEAPLQLLLGPGGSVIERGVLPVLGEAEAGSARCVLVVPGQAVTVRWLNLPTRNDQQAQAAARLALEDILAAPGDVHLALGRLEADGQRPAAVVDPAVLQSWLAAAAARGLTPDVAVPDCLALPEPEEGGPLNSARFDGRLAVRGPRLAFTADDDLAPLLIQGRESRELSPDEIERAMSGAAERPYVNLLQGLFDPAIARRPGWPQLRRAAVLALAVLISPLILMTAQIVRQDIAANRIAARAEARVAAALPAGATVEDPLGQAETALAQARIAAGAGPAALAAQLFAALETIDQAQVESLIAMPDGAMRATVSYVNYSDVDTLAKILGRAGITLRQEGARDEDGRVIGDVILGVRP